MINRALIFLTTVSLMACQTDGIFIREVALNASDARKAIVTVIGEPKSISTNGRVLTSRYHDKKGVFLNELKGNEEHRYSRISILGDRRPYDVQVEVIIEKKNTEELKYDNAQAKEMANKIRKALNQGLDRRNVIDDFRAF